MKIIKSTLIIIISVSAYLTQQPIDEKYKVIAGCISVGATALFSYILDPNYKPKSVSRDERQ